MYKDVVKPTIVLVIICIVVSAMLAIVYNYAGIADLGTGLSQVELDEHINTILPQGKKLVKVNTSIEDKNLMGVYKDEGGAGFAIHLSSKGYSSSGDIKMLVGININGEITGVKILESTETPGIGTQIEENDFIKQYIGKSESVSLKNDGGEIDAISGATISSKAFNVGINKAFEIFTLVKGEQ